jgi:hypothetical protein
MDDKAWDMASLSIVALSWDDDTLPNFFSVPTLYRVEYFLLPFTMDAKISTSIVVT